MSAFRPPTVTGSQAPPTSSVSDLFSTRSVHQTSSQSNDNTYANLCKVVLARRMRNMLTLTAAATFISLFIAVFDPTQLPGSLFNLLPVLLFAPIAFLGTLPLFILRKRTITTPRPPPATRFAQLSQLRSRSTVQILAMYLIGAGFFHFAYVWCASYASKDSKLGLFFYHQGRDSWQLNERRITLAVVHTVVAIFATVQHVVRNRSQVHFDKDTSLLIPARLAARSLVSLRRAVRSTGISVLGFWTVYVVLRRPVLRFILVHIAGSWARPHLYSMMRHSGSYSITLASRVISSSFFFFIVWETTHVCFEVYATQSMLVSRFASNPNQALLSGLRSTDPYYQSFAYLELTILTLTSPERREAIFRDVKPGLNSVSGGGGGGGGAWSGISRECLVLIGKELQKAKGRGEDGQSSTSTSSSSQSPQNGNASSSSNRAPVKSGEVFIPSRPTFFDKFATTPSSASTAQQHAPLTEKATKVVSTALENVSSNLSNRVPTILQTSSNSTSSSSSNNNNSSNDVKPMNLEDVPKVIGSEGKVAKWIPQGLRRGWFEVVPEYKIGKCVARVRETVWAIQALSNLTCASLHEDPYGVAQRDIPKILEAFVRYLDVLDRLEREFEYLTVEQEKLYGGSSESSEEGKGQGGGGGGGGGKGKEVGERWRKVSRESIGEVQDALRQGAKAILTEFAPYLSEFRFPTSIATQLQVLVDWGG